MANNKLPKNSYICIQSFMVNDLNLSGNELLVYGLIYGFCMDKQTEFSGSIQYIQKWLNCNSNKTVHNIINKLIMKNLIIKTSTTNKPNDSNHYTINLNMLDNHATENNTLVNNENHVLDNNYTSAKNTPVKDSTSVNFRPNNVKNTSVASVKITPNNINNNINNINSNSSTENITFSIPTLDDVLKYAKTFGENLYIDGDYFYYYNDRHNWKDNNGYQIRNWKALFNNWNILQKNKVFVKQNEEETRKRNNELKFKKICEHNDYNAKVYRENAVKTTNLTCPSCGKSYPDPSISFFVQDNSMHCNECNTSWIAASKETKHQAV